MGLETLLAAIAAVIAAIGAAFLGGRRSMRKEAEGKQSKANQKTLERMQDAENDTSTDRDAVVDRMRRGGF